MVKVFVSQPMNGMTDDQINDARDKMRADVIAQAANDFAVEDNEIEIMDTIIKDYTPNAHPLLFLGESIKMMADADGVYFGRGWEDARGCRIEHECAKKYGKHVMYEVFPQL